MDFDIDDFAEIFQILAWFAACVGIYFVFQQFRLARKTYVHIHDWNRRNAAQVLFFDFNKNFSMTSIVDAFNYSSIDEPLTIEALNSKFEENKILRLDVAKFLNFCECVAVGIQHGVYDKEIIEAGFKHFLLKGWLVFQTYIKHRQETTTFKSWVTFSNLCTEWEKTSEIELVRAKTGI